MPNKKGIPLIIVIAKIKDIAERDYNGKIYDHILSIFNKLKTGEKRALLKGLINICFIVEDKVLLNNSDLDPIKEHLDDAEHNVVVGATRDDIQDSVGDVPINDTEVDVDVEKELLRLRKLLIRFLIAFIAGMVVLAIVVFSNYEAVVYHTITKGIISAFKYLILF